MSEERLIYQVIKSCDQCPLRVFMEVDAVADEDAHWICRHQAGGFVIAHEGTYHDMEEHGNSVVTRIGQRFPDKCPLPLLNPPPTEPVERSRVVSLPDKNPE